MNSVLLVWMGILTSGNHLPVASYCCETLELKTHPLSGFPSPPTPEIHSSLFLLLLNPRRCRHHHRRRHHQLRLHPSSREMMDLKTLVTRTLEKKGVLAKIQLPRVDLNDPAVRDLLASLQNQAEEKDADGSSPAQEDLKISPATFVEDEAYKNGCH